MSDLVLRFAKDDADVVAIHGFLCVVMGPLLPGGVQAIDPNKSAVEVWRVVNQEAALMALHDDKLVGTLGIVKCDFWWGKGNFLASRWFAVLPDSGAAKPLLRAGLQIGKEAGLELHVYDETRERLLVLNRDPTRQAVNPIFERAPPEPGPVTKH